MHFVRLLRVAMPAACALVITSCSGGTQALAPSSSQPGASNTISSPAQGSNDITGATCDQEQLFVLVNTASSSTIERYILGDTTPVATKQLSDRGTALFVSAKDAYVLTQGAQAMDVYGPHGSSTTIPFRTGYSDLPIPVLSTDGTVLGVAYQDVNSSTQQIDEYRAPFTSAYVHANASLAMPNGGIQVLGPQGSPMVGIEGGGLGGWANIINLPSGSEQSISPTDNSIPTAPGAYDAKNGLLYAYAGTSALGNIDQIDVFDIAHLKYLGAIPLPPVQTLGGLSVNQSTGELYAVVNDNVMVYNYAACQCTTPEHVFQAALPESKQTTLTPVIDAQNKHLLLYESSTDLPEQYQQVVTDQDSVTGVLQNTYHVSNAPDARVYGAVAQ